ncbi:MAG: hypothetical protein F8N37_16795 [Telmatospirillum sp.]|nr:hypothetical protein [Telmatospirillum sp.]
MLTLRELVYALYGVGRLLRFRVDGFDAFDASPRGFWRSFWAALLVLPVWGVILLDQTGEHGASARFAITETIGYAISWLAYPLVMLKIADLLDRWPRYYSYMVAYNWFQLLQAAAWLPLVLLVKVQAPPGLIAIVWLATHGALMTYNWFLARKGLRVDAAPAIAIVVIDLLLSLVVDRFAEMIG